MPVNSYIVDGPEGLVIVGGQLTVSDAQAVRVRVDATGRPAAAMIITHGHPDHYAGAATILDGLSAPIVATAGVAEVVRRDDQEKDGIVDAMMGAEWPSTRRFVNPASEWQRVQRTRRATPKSGSDLVFRIGIPYGI